MKRAVIGYPIKGEEVLLIYKKRGFGKGLYNGFGGKVEEGESLEETLIREGQEELSITPVEFEKLADIDFYDNGKLSFIVKAYLIYKWEGTEMETDEAKPFWFNKKELPFENMWEDDRYWLPPVLNGKKIEARFYFKDLFSSSPKMHEKFIRILY